MAGALIGLPPAPATPRMVTTGDWSCAPMTVPSALECSTPDHLTGAAALLRSPAGSAPRKFELAGRNTLRGDCQLSPNAALILMQAHDSAQCALVP